MNIKLIRLIIPITIIILTICTLYIILYRIKMKIYKPSKTAAFLTLSFILIIFLFLIIYGLYLKKGLFFNGCMIFSLILIIFSIYRLIHVSK
jgi:hypothetical protein